MGKDERSKLPRSVELPIYEWDSYAQTLISLLIDDVKIPMFSTSTREALNDLLNEISYQVGIPLMLK